MSQTKTTWSMLESIAQAYYVHLSQPEVNERLSHHFAHVAPEGWLALELAYLINRQSESVVLPGWSAVVERKRVDVTLLPPSANDKAIHLEFKLIAVDYWLNWGEVYHDLGFRRKGSTDQHKPVADFAVCFVLGQPFVYARKRKTTLASDTQKLGLLPDEPGCFQPLYDKPELDAIWISPQLKITWDKPIPDRWPGGYRNSVRVIWISTTGN
ncbi:MAG: hypothetical protein ABL888_03995 [Pirellulaceae bacterium]